MDADQVLKINPGNVRGLTNKAEMQYNLGNFEHSLKYFHRANLLRPGHQGVLSGVSKAREAVDNALSRARGFSFGSMRDTIQLGSFLFAIDVAVLVVDEGVVFLLCILLLLLLLLLMLLLQLPQMFLF